MADVTDVFEIELHDEERLEEEDDDIIDIIDDVSFHKFSLIYIDIVCVRLRIKSIKLYKNNPSRGCPLQSMTFSNIIIVHSLVHTHALSHQQPTILVSLRGEQ